VFVGAEGNPRGYQLDPPLNPWDNHCQFSIENSTLKDCSGIVRGDFYVFV